MRQPRRGDYVFARVVREKGAEHLPVKYREGVVTEIKCDGTMKIQAPPGDYLCHNDKEVIIVPDRDLFGEIKEFVLKRRRSLKRNK